MAAQDSRGFGTSRAADPSPEACPAPRSDSAACSRASPPGPTRPLRLTPSSHSHCSYLRRPFHRSPARAYRSNPDHGPTSARQIPHPRCFPRPATLFRSFSPSFLPHHAFFGFPVSLFPLLDEGPGGQHARGGDLVGHEPVNDVAELGQDAAIHAFDGLPEAFRRDVRDFLRPLRGLLRMGGARRVPALRSHQSHRHRALPLRAALHRGIEEASGTVHQGHHVLFVGVREAAQPPDGLLLAAQRELLEATLLLAEIHDGDGGVAHELLVGQVQREKLAGSLFVEGDFARVLAQKRDEALHGIVFRRARVDGGVARQTGFGFEEREALVAAQLLRFHDLIAGRKEIRYVLKETAWNNILRCASSEQCFCTEHNLTNVRHLRDVAQKGGIFARSGGVLAAIAADAESTFLRLREFR